MDDKESEPRPVDEIYEIHPLDRDYSSPTQPPRIPAIEFHPKVRRIGATVFAAGFLTVFLAAILLGNVRGSGLMESIASGVHRAGMVLILVGGILVILAYRLHQLKGISIRLPDGKIQWNVMQSYRALVLWNVVGFLVIVPILHLLQSIRSPVFYFLIFNGMLTLVCGFLATVAIWHRGFIRAYAVGVLVSLLLRGHNPFLFSFNGWGGTAGVQFLPAISLAITLITGLVCGGYVCLLESASSRKTDRVNRERGE
jgi:hypothetical protein